MNPTEILRIVDAIHRDKNIDPEIVFEGIESALVSAAKKHYGELADIQVHIDREDGSISGTHDGAPLDPEETIGRIGAQTAKQVMIQKIREAERDHLYDLYQGQIGQMTSGIVQRYDGGTATVALGDVEAILPRSEQIPGETHHVNERVRTTVFEVKKAGSRVKVILSRIRADLVRGLFEQEIPEIADEIIEIRAMAREAGYRTKVAVSSSDQRVDCVGACVGVRGNRIKNIVDELAGERIDIVRWSDDPQVMIPNSLQPAEVEEVILCQMLGRAIVLVREDQLSLAIGRRGQNVRLGSRLSGWDIEIMTADELNEQIEGAVIGFSALEGISEELADKLVGEGFLTYDDLSIIEPDALMEMGSLTAAEVDTIVAQAEAKAEEAEEIAKEQRRLRRERERLEAEAAEAAAALGEVLPDTKETAAEATPAAESTADQASEEATPAETPADDTASADVVDTDAAAEVTDVSAAEVTDTAEADVDGDVAADSVGEEQPADEVKADKGTEASSSG